MLTIYIFREGKQPKGVHTGSAGEHQTALSSSLVLKYNRTDRGCSYIVRKNLHSQVAVEGEFVQLHKLNPAGLAAGAMSTAELFSFPVFSANSAGLNSAMTAPTHNQWIVS